MALLQISEPGQTPDPHQRRIAIGIDLGIGKAAARVWGCDLTEGYIKENAYYTT